MKSRINKLHHQNFLYVDCVRLYIPYIISYIPHILLFGLRENKVMIGGTGLSLVIITTEDIRKTYHTHTHSNSYTRVWLTFSALRLILTPGVRHSRTWTMTQKMTEKREKRYYSYHYPQCVFPQHLVIGTSNPLCGTPLTNHL